MTYTVLSGTLNSTIPYHTMLLTYKQNNKMCVIWLFKFLCIYILAVIVNFLMTGYDWLYHVLWLYCKQVCVLFVTSDSALVQQQKPNLTSTNSWWSHCEIIWPLYFIYSQM